MSLLPTIFHVIFSYIVIGLMRFATVDAAPIVLFEDAQFKGINSTFQIGESTCVNLVGKLNDFYSSVDSMGVCFLLCEHVNCRGKCEKVGGKLRDLSNIGLNDLVSSLSLCDDGDDDATAANQDHQDVQPDTPSTTTTTTSTRIFRRRSISTTITAPSRNRKRTKATRSTARKTRTRKSRKLTQISLPSLSPSTAKPIVHYLNHDVAWSTAESESTTMSSSLSSPSSTIQKHNSNIIVNTTTNSQNNNKTANHLPVGVVHNSSRSDDDGGGGRRRYRINVSSYDTHTSKDFDIAKSYPRRRIPSLSNHRRRRKQLLRQEQQQPIIIEKEQITSPS